MQRTSSGCRVAVVDDDALELEAMVRSLRAAVEEYRLGPVEIEAFGEAQTVARQVRLAGASPPWDVILSDVLMPDVESGGFAIARAIRERYAGQPVPLKLALVTRRAAYLNAFRPFREFSVADTADWFWFFVKEEGGGDASGEPLLPAAAWKRALAQMIHLRDTERWGFRPLRTMHDLGLAREALRSPAATAVLTRMVSLAENPRIRTVVLAAEPESDLLPLAARLLHFHRARVHGSAGMFTITCEPANDASLAPALFGSALRSAAAMDRPGRLELAAGGTLFVDRADALPHEAREALVRAIVDQEFARVGESRSRQMEVGLLVLGVAPAAEGRRGEPLSALRPRTDTGWERLPPLAERPEDVVPMAEAVLEDLAPGEVPALSDDAKEWLRSRAPRFSTLAELIKTGSEYGSKALVTAEDLAGAAAGVAAPGAGTPRDPATEPWPRIKLLLVLVSPRNQKRLRLDEEYRRVTEAVRRGKARDRFAHIDVRMATTDRDLQRALLDDDWTIVHFGGHGCEQGLILEDNAGNARPLPVGALARMLAQQRDSLRCVLLNACSTSTQGRRIACEIPFVVSSRSRIADPVAIRFAEAFYDALAAGRSASVALEAGEIALEAASVPREHWPERVRCEAIV